ncbi:hypothetical protein [Tessaracoccus palaemonis]|uniref:Uncharacterized protein n=1 Tax=Tessaracoccus palaemonis TaxID=2829499 RepID=A0ABX8SMR4_9ACTN|nr:hypothetical protein [Tessaracoccus palaemonis]QXT63692.1 hypothetical protein KDB89_04235 [Tessaracoccus palaemonis]
MDDNLMRTGHAVLLWGALSSGAVEAVALALGGTQAVGPTALLGVTVAALVAGPVGRGARIATFFAAAAALVLRVVLIVVQAVAVATPAAMLGSVAGLLLGGALLTLALLQVQARGDLATAPARGPVPPASAATPVHAPRPAPGAGRWDRATTPWPRVDEDDPDATLIRPPRR